MYFTIKMKSINEYSDEENLTDNSIIDIFRKQNDLINYNKEHSNFYLHPAQIGAGDNYCDANTLIEWYRRNIYNPSMITIIYILFNNSQTYHQ